MTIQLQSPPPGAAVAALADSVSLDGLAANSRIILAIAPCRSGTTAMMRAFGALGIESHLQPLKNLLRWRLVGEAQRWQPASDAEVLFIKETLGPFSEAEVLFDPLAVLLATGLPAERISLLLMGRTPLETWASWRHWWCDRTTLELFVKTYQQAERIRQLAERQGVATTTLVYEAFRDNPAATVMQRLCSRLGIAYDEVAVAGWQQLPPLGERGSRVVIPRMPERFTTREIRQRVEEGEGFSHYSRAEEVMRLSQAEVDYIEAAGIPGLYEAWRAASAGELGLHID